MMKHAESVFLLHFSFSFTFILFMYMFLLSTLVSHLWKECENDGLRLFD